MRLSLAVLLALGWLLLSSPASAQAPPHAKAETYYIKLSNATLHDLRVVWNSREYTCPFPKVLKMASAETYECRGSGKHDALSIQLDDNAKQHGCEANFTVYKYDFGPMMGRVDSSRATRVTCRVTAGQDAHIKITN